MANSAGTAYIDIEARLDKLERELESKLTPAVDKAAANTEKKFTSAFKGIATAAGGMLSSKILGDFAAEMGAASVTLDVFARKSKTVFEGSAGDIQSWAEKNAHAMGLTDQELVGLAASFGDLVKPMGFTSEQAAKMSQEVVGLSGVLSAWSGNQRSSAEVADILTKAMLGERDGLKALGISISEADVQARLALKGQQDLTGAALEQAKAVATQELIFAKSTDAQKAWADGSLDAAKKSNQLKAIISEVREEIAQRFGPALGMIAPAIQTLGPALSGLGGIAQATGMSFGEMATKLGKFGLVAGTVAAGALAIHSALSQMNEGVKLSASQIATLSRSTTPEVLTAFDKMASKGKSWGFDMATIFRDVATNSFGTAQRIVEGLEAQGNKTREQEALLVTYKTILGEVGAANRQAAADAEVHAGAQGGLTDATSALSAAIDAQEVDFQELSASIDDWSGRVDRALGVELELEEAQSRTQAAIDDLSASLEKNGVTFDLNTAEGRENAAGRRDLVTAAAEEVAALVRSGEVGAADTVQKEALRQKLVELQQTFPALAGDIQGYITTVEGIPTEKVTLVQAITGDAIAGIEAVGSALANLQDRTVTVTTAYRTVGSAAADAAGGVHTGGLITSHGVMRFGAGDVVPGSGNRDTVPAWLTPGEFVVNADAVQAVGLSTLRSINAMHDGGIVAGGYASGRSPSGQMTTIAGPIMLDVASIAALAQALRDAPPVVRVSDVSRGLQSARVSRS